MTTTTTGTEKYSVTTRAMAAFCHNCSVCAWANRDPQSRFARVMEWHRGWCPAWAAHTKVYGLKDLSA